jgi:hypothetical protein
MDDNDNDKHDALNIEPTENEDMRMYIDDSYPHAISPLMAVASCISNRRGEGGVDFVVCHREAWTVQLVPILSSSSHEKDHDEQDMMEEAYSCVDRTAFMSTRIECRAALLRNAA